MVNPFANSSGGGIKLPAGLSDPDLQSSFRWEPGPRMAKLLDIREGESKSGKKKLTFDFDVEVTPGKFANIRMDCSLEATGGLRAIAGVLNALGAPCEGDIDPSEYKGKKVTVALDDWHKDNGKTVSQITGVEKYDNDDVPF